MPRYAARLARTSTPPIANCDLMPASMSDSFSGGKVRKAEPVGDIAARYFDAQGKPVLGPVHERVLAVTLSELAAIPTVVGVACGRVKAAGVLGAMRGRLIDVLVCDESLARAVLTDTPTDESEAARILAALRA